MRLTKLIVFGTKCDWFYTLGKFISLLSAYLIFPILDLFKKVTLTSLGSSEYAVPNYITACGSPVNA